MSSDIYTYWFWNNLFSKSQILDLQKIFIENQTDECSDVPAKNAVKKTKSYFTYISHFKNNLYNLNQRILDVNKKHFGYILYDINDYDVTFLNEYHSSEEGEYDWHKDGSNTHIFDHKFTVLINCSDVEYEGGEFMLMSNGGGMIVNEFSKPGDVLLFPSHIYHKVNKVTKGVRKSMAFFYSGPKFK